MSELGKIGKFFLSPVLALTGALDKKSTPTPQALPVPTVDQSAAAAAAAQANQDSIRQRRGAGANVLTGAGGAEASTPGAKVLLGQ